MYPLSFVNQLKNMNDKQHKKHDFSQLYVVFYYEHLMLPKKNNVYYFSNVFYELQQRIKKEEIL